MLECDSITLCEKIQENRTNKNEPYDFEPEPEPESKTYVTYFQSVTTLCVFTIAKNQEEAEVIAKNKIKNGEISNSLIDRVPFALEKTEEFNDQNNCL